MLLFKQVLIRAFMLFFYHLKHIVWNTQSIYFLTKVDELFVYFHFCAILEKISMFSYEIRNIAFAPLLPDFVGLFLVTLRVGKL